MLSVLFFQLNVDHTTERDEDIDVYPSSEDNFGSVGHIYQNIDEVRKTNRINLIKIRPK